MILTIPDPDGYGPYMIVGAARNHFFQGSNCAIGRRYEVAAKWADIAGTYVGLWVEDGCDFLFSFHLGE